MRRRPRQGFGACWRKISCRSRAVAQLLGQNLGGHRGSPQKSFEILPKMAQNGPKPPKTTCFSTTFKLFRLRCLRSEDLSGLTMQWKLLRALRNYSEAQSCWETRLQALLAPESPWEIERHGPRGALVRPWCEARAAGAQCAGAHVQGALGQRADTARHGGQSRVI